MRIQKRPIGLGLSAGVLAACSAVTTLMILWAAPGSIREELAGMLQQPKILVLDWLPVFLLMLAFALFFRNVFFSAALVTVVTMGMAAGNRVKLLIRDEPFVPKDLALLKEAADAAGNYDIQFPWSILAVTAAVALILAVMGKLFPLAPPAKERSVPLRWLIRLGGGGAALGTLVCAVLFVYSSKPLYNSFVTSNPYYLPSVCNELGFPYFFCYHFSAYKLTRPEGFDRKAVEVYETGDTPSPGADVHVVIVMNEAFYDLTNNEVFLYDPEDDPLGCFNALAADDRTISGCIVVPNFAGGTANTEFDVMTGMRTNVVSSSGSSFRVFNRNLDSVLRVYQNAGYHTLYMHPGNPWFYNRENVYPYLGSEEELFMDDLADVRRKGRWITDETVTDNLIAEFEETVSAGKKFCGMAVTIQNHMSYTPDKYGTDVEVRPAQTSVELSEQAQSLVSVYIEGLRDADAMLGELHEYFAASSEPVVLVYYGDHLPYLGDNRLAYRELGLPAGEEQGENPFAGFETPFLIWYNDAAQAALGDAPGSLDLPEDGSISASYLGAVLLELTGHREDSPWFAFLNDLRRELPVAHNGQYRTADGKLTDSLSPELSQQIEKWQNWSYYKLNYKKIP